MSHNTIKSFFTPCSSGSVKRLRSSSSPELLQDTMAGGSDKVGDLTRDQLMAGLSSLLDTKLSKLATKDDLTELSSKVTALGEENRLLKEEIDSLKARESVILSKLVDLEGRSRRNNLIFRGLKVGNSKDYKYVVSKFCSEVFGSNDALWINRAHMLGRDQTAIIAHIPNDSDVEYIMSRVKTLKGTGYTVHRDFPLEVRQKRAKLAAVRREVERVTGKRRMPIAVDHLTIEGCRFSWEEGRLMAGRQDGADKLKSILGKDFTEFLVNLQSGSSGDWQQRQTDPPSTRTPTPTAERTYAAATGSVVN